MSCYRKPSLKHRNERFHDLNHDFNNIEYDSCKNTFLCENIRTTNNNNQIKIKNNI